MTTAAAKVWNHKRWGRVEDPIHKSHMSDLIGMFGCFAATRYKRNAEMQPEVKRDGGIPGKAAVGNAGHETIAHTLENKELRDRLLMGGDVNLADVSKAFREELALEADGRELIWYAKKDDPEKIIDDACMMVTGLLNDLHNHVAEILLIEGGFVVPLGDVSEPEKLYWLAGHVDLLYRALDGRIGMVDWKTGKQKPHQIILDHGFESGIYSQAVHAGVFVPRDSVTCTKLDNGDWLATADAPHCSMEPVHVRRMTRFNAEREAMNQLLSLVGILMCTNDPDIAPPEPTFGEFPDHLHYCHMPDYVPYLKKTNKRAERPEEIEFYGLDGPSKVECVAGDIRGPAWYRMRRSAHDVPRLEHLLRNVVGTVRMGRFFESVGEKCTRCSFKTDCLSRGYGLTGGQAEQAKSILDLLDE